MVGAVQKWGAWGLCPRNSCFSTSDEGHCVKHQSSIARTPHYSSEARNLYCYAKSPNI